MTGRLYKEEFLYHYKNQPNKKKLKNPTHIGNGANVSCGDRLEIELNVQDGTINDIGYSSDGCMVLEAAAAILSEKVKGMCVCDASNLTKDDYLGMLEIGLTPSREKCALAGYDAFIKALKERV